MTAPLNGTSFIDDPFGTIFSCWTDFFESILGPGGGNIFWLIVVLILTFGLAVKNKGETMLPVVFLIVSSTMLTLGNIFVHAYGVALITGALCAIALTSLILNVVFHRGG